MSGDDKEHQALARPEDEEFELGRPLMMFLRSVPSGYQCHFEEHTFIPLKRYCEAAAVRIERLEAQLSAPSHVAPMTHAEHMKYIKEEAPVSSIAPKPVAWRFRERMPVTLEWGEWWHVSYQPQGPANGRFEFEPLYAAPVAVSAIAAIPIDVLRGHYLSHITCDEETNTDNPVCSCSTVHLGWHPSIGAAVEAWIQHVSEMAATDGSTNG